MGHAVLAQISRCDRSPLLSQTQRNACPKFRLHFSLLDLWAGTSSWSEFHRGLHLLRGGPQAGFKELPPQRASAAVLVLAGPGYLAPSP